MRTIPIPIAPFGVVDQSNPSTNTSRTMSVVNLLIAVVLVMLSGLFSGLNLGLMSFADEDLRIVIEGSPDDQEKRDAARIKPLRERGNLLLCTLLLGNTLVNAMIAILLSDMTSGIVGGLVTTGLIVIFGEIIPQSVSARARARARGWRFVARVVPTSAGWRGCVVLRLSALPPRPLRPRTPLSRTRAAMALAVCARTTPSRASGVGRRSRRGVLALRALDRRDVGANRVALPRRLPADRVADLEGSGVGGERNRAEERRPTAKPTSTTTTITTTTTTRATRSGACSSENGRRNDARLARRPVVAGVKGRE